MQKKKKNEIKKENKIFRIDKEIIINAIFNVSKILLFVFSFIIFILLSRIISSKALGCYFLILAIIEIFVLFSIPGLKPIIFKLSSQGYDGAYFKALKLRIKSSFFGSIILILLGLYFIFFNKTSFHNEIGFSLIIFSLIAPLYYSLDLWMVLLKGKQKFKILFLFIFIISITNFLLFIFFIVFLNLINIIFLIIIHFIGTVVFNIIFSIYCQKYIKNDLINNNWRKQGFLLNFNYLSLIVYHAVDILLLSLFLPLESIAIYGIVIIISDIFFMVFFSLAEVFFPRIYKSEEDLYFKEIFLIFLISFIIPILLGFVIDIPILILFNSKYFDVIPYCKIILYSIPFIILSGFLGSYLNKHNLIKEINITRIITILATILSYSILIPLFGIYGAVLCSVNYFVIQDICMLVSIFFNKDLKKKKIL